MGIWIEIHCDVRKAGCFDDVNDGSMAMARSTMASMLNAYAIVKKDAIDKGWKHKSGEWICPHCAKSPNDKLSGRLPG